MIYSILFTLMLSISSSFAQGVQVMDLSPDDPPPESQTQPAHDPSATHVDHSQDDVEQLAEEIEAKRKKQAAMARSIEESGQILPKTIQEIQRTGELNLNTIRNMDKQTIKFLQDKLREGHMGKLPEQEVRKSILEKCKGKPLEKLYAKFPVLLDISVDFVRDPEAMPSLLGIFAKRKLLKNFIVVWVVLVLLALGIRLFMFPKKWHGFKRFCATLTLNLSITCLSLVIFYQLFEKEVGPTVKVIARHF